MLNLSLSDLCGVSPLPSAYGVLGDPIAHSRSPAMQQAAFDFYGLSCVYYRLHIRSSELTLAVSALRGVPFGGWNCTLPHKVAMAGLCDELAPSARQFGSVNTVVVQNGGWLVGHNTDGLGWSCALRDAFGVGPEHERILLLGAGGAGRAVAIQALIEGCPQLIIANRNEVRGRELLVELEPFAGSSQIELTDFSSGLSESLARSTLVVNATSAGLDTNADPILVASQLPSGIRLFDTIYGMGSEKLRMECKRANISWCDGLGMLLYQGAEAFRLWTGNEPPLSNMRSALLH